MEFDGYDFNMSQRQTLNYILSMNQDINLKTFRGFYNRFNDKKSLRKINDEFIEPLMDMELLIREEIRKVIYMIINIILCLILKMKLWILIRVR